MNDWSPFLRLLLVEDDPVLRSSLDHTLRAARHSVTVAADGARAPTPSAPGGFDVVITDLRAPDIDAPTRLRTLRWCSPSAEVVLLAAHTQTAEAVAALKAGAWAYLTKPFDHEELLVQLDRVAARRRLESEVARRPPSDALIALPGRSVDEGGDLLPLSTAMRAFEREHIRRALEVSSGRRMRAAALLGISRKSLWEKARMYGLGGVEHGAPRVVAAGSELHVDQPAP